LVDRVVDVGDLVLKETEAQQLRGLKTTEAVKREIVVRSASNPAFVKGIDRVCTAQDSWIGDGVNIPVITE
jgi:hypothetical protein